MADVRARLVLSALGMMVVAGASAAWCQEAPQAGCTYERCAIRLQYHRSPRLVQGAQDSVVAKFGLLPPQIPLLAQSRDSLVRAHFANYRSAAKHGVGWGAAAATLLIASGIVYVTDTQNDANQGLSLGLLIGGTLLTIPTAHYNSRAADELQATIWQFNKQFAR